MIKHFLIAIMAVILIGCMASQKDGEGLPDDIQGLRSAQKETKTQINELTKKLERIEDKMKEIDPSSFKADPKLVTVMDLGVDEFRSYTKIQGQVDSRDEVFLSSETGGRLTSLSVKEGQAVRKGQQLASVDLQSLRNQRAEIEKSLELAVDVYERHKKLFEQNIGSEVQYIQSKNQVESLEKSLETIDHELSKAAIYAPITGEVDVVFKENGEMLAPGEPIAKIIDNRQLTVVANVPESYLRMVKRGDMVHIDIPAIGLEKEEKISRIGATIEPQNRTFAVEVDLTNNDGFLKPNLIAHMLINDITRDSVISVPVNLVQQEVSGRYFLYVVSEKEEQATAEKRFVTTAESYGGNVIITDGLSSEDKVIVKGAMNVANGESVKIVEENNNTAHN